MVVAWLFILVGAAMIVWNRRLANALVAMDRTIAGVLRVSVARRRVQAPWRPAYTRFAVVFVGLTWTGLGVVALIASLSFPVGS